MEVEQNKSTTDSLTIHFEREEGDQHNVPAALLAKVIEATQQIVYLLAYQEEGITVAERVRLQREIEVNYTLLCSPLQPGSVTVPMHFASVLGLTERQQKVTDLFASVSSAVAQNDDRKLVKGLPSEPLRRRFLQKVDEMVPSSTSGFRVTLSGPRDLSLVLSESTRRHAKELLRSTASAAPPAVNRTTITGTLTRIDFIERKLTLQYPVNSRELVCIYSDDVEDNLLAERRGWIQVTGNVVLDASGSPTSVTDVEEVIPLDLSPIDLYRFDDEESGMSLRFRTPLSLTPTQDDSRQLLLLDYNDLNIHLCAFTREELEDALYGLIWVLWDDYANASDAKLSSNGRALKTRLTRAIEETPIATR